jgi:hypothetical protein
MREPARQYEGLYVAGVISWILEVVRNLATLLLVVSVRELNKRSREWRQGQHQGRVKRVALRNARIHEDTS